MAKAVSAKAGGQPGGRGGSEKRSGGSSQPPRGAGPGKSQPASSLETTAQPLFSRFSDRTVIVFLAVAAALPYLNTLRNGFVSDDATQVIHNPYIRSFHYWTKFFTTPVSSYFAQKMVNYYRPMMSVGYLLCYQLWGPRPFAFHFANLLLNAAVVGAVFLLTQRMFQNRDLAIMATALFALHPIHTEAVAWIAASPDLELSLFYLVTFWLFLAGARPGGRLSYLAQIAMAGSFVLALLSKEQAVTLPVLATVYEHFYRVDRQETRPAQKVRRYALLWLLTLAYLLFRLRVLGALGSSQGVHDLTWYGTLASALALLGQYLLKVLLPVDLRVFCPFHPPFSLVDPPVIVGLAALAVCGGLFFLLWRTARPLSFGLVWMLVTLAPVLNARWMPLFAFADRYLYLPSVGFCWVLGWGLLRLWVNAPGRRAIWRRGLAGAFAILAVLCLFRIVTRNRDWRNNLTLYKNTLAACPDAFYVRKDLGATYWEMGNAELAEREWRETLETAPEESNALSNLGLLYLKKEDYAQAVKFLQKALEYSPDNSEAHLFLGLVYVDTHRLELAEPELRTAISLAPFNSNARNGLGTFYVEEGRAAEAEEQFRESLAIEPNVTAYGNLGLLYWRQGDAQRAEQQWLEALRLAPNDSSVLNNLGLACSKLQRYPEAVSFFRQAIALKPDDPSPHSNLGLALQKSGQPQAAEAEFRAALSLAPQKFETRNRLGTLLLEAGRVEEAEEQFRLSLKTQANASGYCGLGEVELRRGDPGGAERAFRSAVRLDAGDSQAHLELGALYESQGRRGEALKEYEAQLKSDPGNREAQAAVQKLSSRLGEE